MNYNAKINDYRIKINSDMDYVNGQIRRLKGMLLSAKGPAKKQMENELREMNMQIKVLRELKSTLEHTHRSLTSQNPHQR